MIPLLKTWLHAEAFRDQPNTKEVAQSVSDMVEERRQFGMKKYSQELMTGDQRDDVVDIMQEALDMLIYLYKAKLNGRILEARKEITPVLFAAIALMDEALAAQAAKTTT